MQAGRLTEKVVLLRPEVIKNDFGGERTIYIEDREVWAEVQWKGGSTGMEVGEFFMNERIDVLIRIQHKVSEGWRIKQRTMNKNLFHIRAIEPNRQKMLNRLICERVNE